MKNRKLMLFLRFSLAAMVLAPFGSALAECKLVKSEDGIRKYYLVGDCRLADLFPKPPYELQRNPDFKPRLIIHLPNLHLTNIRQATFPSSVDVEIYSETENDGAVAVSSFDARLDWSIVDPSSSAIVDQGTDTITLNGLGVGQDRMDYVASIRVPDRNQDWDVEMTLQVDPDATVGGAIWETNETDNTKFESCRVYGPAPDTSKRPC